MSSVGPVLSEFRKRKRLSQLDLSLMAQVSSRHISFIETGKTSPSRAMLMRLSEVLELPLSDSNLLLFSGGYAAPYSQLDFNSEAMRPVIAALSLILENHNPFPAVVLDGAWNILMANSAQQKLTALITGAETVDMKSTPEQNTNEPVNLLISLFDDQILRGAIINWQEVASFLLRRLQRQINAYAKTEHQDLMQQLLAMQPPKNWQQPEQAKADGPMLTVEIAVADYRLSLFSTLSQFGTALDIGMEELLIESYFPTDSVSREFFASLIL